VCIYFVGSEVGTDFFFVSSFFLVIQLKVKWVAPIASPHRCVCVRERESEGGSEGEGGREGGRGREGAREGATERRSEGGRQREEGRERARGSEGGREGGAQVCVCVCVCVCVRVCVCTRWHD